VTKRTIVLIILDGWGLGRPNESNPIYVVKPEIFEWLDNNFPVTSLQASGISVGLPWGETGNSEVGHLTMGAGKVIYQYYPLITITINDKSFFLNPALKSAMDHAKENNSAVNLVGLLSTGNTHASIEHLEALIKMAEDEKVPNIKLHLFSDGKDGPPKKLGELIKKLPNNYLASLTGRYYAMDRNQNWQLTQKAYECIMGISGEKTDNLDKSISETYEKGFTEEYLPPLNLGPEKSIKDNESIIFFNYREDSIRQISECFLNPSFDKFPIKKLDNAYIATFTRYEEKFSAPVAFPPQTVENPLGKVLSDAGKTQLRLAETYKYAHVTFFFNGYRESPFKNEYRVLIPSHTAIHPEERPEMMASLITNRIIEAIQNQGFDFVLANYANPDTMAHTGNYQSSLEAVKIMNREIGRILKAAANTQTIILITSDHGNLEEVLSPTTGYIETQHDPNPVPFYLIGQEFKGRKFMNWRGLTNETLGILSDIAPTILDLMDIPQPKEMNGSSLLKGLIL
jgi:2,3-bisphosphoglycerate-independent phosphoglycerate mutase